MLEVHVRRTLGDFVLDAVLEGGEGILAVVGPSGSGKSALLRAIAGVLRPEAGRIVANSRVLFDSAAGVDLPPEQRRVGYVPQESGLFPHLTVVGNVGFGLHGRRSGDRAIVDEVIAMCGLEAQRQLRPAQLSGGQKRRAALARALAVRPDLLLLDEPFAAVDVPTRQALMEDVRRVVASTATPTVLVTHDRDEAIRLADQVAVLIGGRVRQQGTPAEVFGAPVDEEVARFVGVEVLVKGVVSAVEGGVAITEAGGHLIEGGTGVAPGDEVLVCLRPEDVVIAPSDGTSKSSARNRLSATVVRVEPWGPFRRVELDCGFPLSALVTRRAEEELGIVPGAAVVATFKAAAVHLVRR